MSKPTLRQRVRNLLLNDDDKELTKAGFTYKTGTLTKEGRKVVLDYMFENDPELKAAMVATARDLNKEEASK